MLPKKVIDVFRDNGLKSSESQVLFYLLNYGESFSSEIEETTDLSQPEVSMGVKALKERGWIKERLFRARARGRPKIKYSVHIHKIKILEFLTKSICKEIKELNKIVDDLNNLKIGEDKK